MYIVHCICYFIVLKLHTGSNYTGVCWGGGGGGHNCMLWGGLVIAVGGEQSSWLGEKITNTLLSFIASEGGRWKWVEHFPPMPTKRVFSAVVCSGKALVVAVGKGESYTTLTTVEVMNTDTLQWSIASSLPHPRSDATATVCGDRVYLVGGVGPTWPHKIHLHLLSECPPPVTDSGSKGHGYVSN